MSVDLSIYLVTEPDPRRRQGRALVETVAAAVAGGVTVVQLRDKDVDDNAMLQLVEALSRSLPGHVPLLINDRVDVFVEAKARGLRVAGVHVGQDDLPVEQVRARIGPDAVLGLTANTEAELAGAAASAIRIDYVGIGVVRTTASKPDAPPPLGVAGVVRLAGGCPLPAVAIGGIEPTDLAPLRAGGLAGAAVVSWICAADDPRAAAVNLAEAWQAAA